MERLRAAGRPGARVLRAAGVGMLVLGGCDSPGRQPEAGGITPMEVIEPGLVLTSPIHSRSEWTVSDTFALFRAADLVVMPEGLLVGDSGNDRLILFDRELQPLRTIGRSGAGPGELRQPFRIRAGHGLLVASELGNPRFSVFLADGTFSHVVPRLGIEGVFDVASDGTIFRGSDADGHYLLRVRSDGDTASLVAIPAEVRSLRRPNRIEVRWRSDFVVATPGDTLHIFDNEVGALVKVDTAGRIHAMRTLPEALRKPILERSERRFRSLTDAGHRIVGSTIAKHLSVTSSGDLYLAVGFERIVGLLIDPHTYAARYVRIPRDTGDWALVTNAMANAVEDSTMYALGMEGLASFRLRPDD